ncbi:MAG: hypothetical protein CMN26_10760 [Salinisphaera sp.]|nr:hypothetical protein [Salinisphaera sp.]|tara:strand:+ start:3797 stop:5245 length:1449 start_codon:yes stop_codon:yes gene_type:complete
MFPGAFKRRWTLRWAVGRVVTALVIALVFVAADYAGAAEPTLEGYRADRSNFNFSGFGSTETAACMDIAEKAVQEVSTYEAVENATFAGGELCDIQLQRGYPWNDTVNISSVKVAPVMLCPDGTYPVDGECPEQECEEGETFSVTLDLVGAADAYKTWVSPDGCFFERVGVSACLIGVDTSENPGGQCAFTYRGTGEQVGGPETNAPPPEITTIDVSSMNTPTKRNRNEGAPNTTELSDGTTITTQTTVDTTTGGGSADVSEGDGTYTFNVVKNSNSTTTTTVTTTNSADGSTTQETTTSNSWTNGDTLGANVTSDGTVTVSTTEGSNGGGSETTTTTTNPDGSSTTETTTNGGAGAGAGAVCESGECSNENNATNGDGEGEGEGEGDEFAGPDLGDVGTFAESYGKFTDAVTSSQFGQALDGLGNISGGGSCPTAEFELFDRQMSIDMHCTILDNSAISGTLSVIFLALWTLSGIFIIFMV